ncbi:MAG: tRNA (adenosine(37)-N6)-dimethylallyltransferase MiaA [Oscillospiraceae bacterium]|nr:tRNA (adenosine(37)-N6)-dimethylallyltransferase MiaA [Oscillospiraceae bacterium]
MNKGKVIVITGPTASGKSELGLYVAKEVGGEIVSADSMQIYRYMNIGTAKPSLKEQLSVPHHMIDIISPFDSYSAALYVKDAVSCIDGIHERGKLPIIVGGTGLYIDSLISARSFSPVSDDALRKSLEMEYEQTSGKAMLDKLKRFDEASANTLHENDKKRIVRAMEVYMLSGKTISVHDMETKSIPPRYDVVKFALTYANREILYEIINKRVDIMLEMGLYGEVLKLIEMGVPSSSTAMQAIGYKEMFAVINGECELSIAVDKIKMETRRYAKRQLTWLRRDKDIKWLYKDDDGKGDVRLQLLSALDSVLKPSQCFENTP